MTLSVGGLVAVLVLAVCGSVNWVVRRARGAPRTWWASTFTVWVMLVAFAFALFSSAGRSLKETQAADEKAAVAVGGKDELTRQRDDYARWFRGFAASADSFFDGGLGDVKFKKYLDSASATNGEVLRRAKDVRQDYIRWRAQVRRLPTPSTYYAGPNADLNKAADLYVHSYDLYIEGFRTPSGDKAGDRKLEAGDSAQVRAGTLFKRVGTRVDDKYEELGSESFGRTIGIDAYAEKAQRRAAEVKRITGS